MPSVWRVGCSASPPPCSWSESGAGRSWSTPTNWPTRSARWRRATWCPIVWPLGWRPSSSMPGSMVPALRSRPIRCWPTRRSGRSSSSSWPRVWKRRPRATRAEASVDVAAILLPASGQITTGLNEAGVPVNAEQVEAALSQLDPLVIRDPARSAIRRGFLAAGSQSGHGRDARRVAHALRRNCLHRHVDGSDASIQGAAHPLRARGALVCCAAANRFMACRPGGRKGALPGELRAPGELEMDGAADHRPGRDGRGDRLPRVPPAGQTGGSVPLRRRAAHTPRSMIPVTMRMVFTHLVGRGSNPTRAPQQEPGPSAERQTVRSRHQRVVAEGGSPDRPGSGRRRPGSCHSPGRPSR